VEHKSRKLEGRTERYDIGRNVWIRDGDCKIGGFPLNESISRSYTFSVMSTTQAQHALAFTFAGLLDEKLYMIPTELNTRPLMS